MTQHDSWVRLCSNSPYDALLELFPKGFPVRDPFPIGTGRTRQGEAVSLWAIDIDRLDMDQCEAIANTIASQLGADPDEILDEAIEHGSFGLDNR